MGTKHSSEEEDLLQSSWMAKKWVLPRIFLPTLINFHCERGKGLEKGFLFVWNK